ncbi:MAG: hypothetical protein HGB04_01670 [Chlorobiaceae bacterium]|nr:hypothetical protein [Chlorobiaceae bacterium]
MAESQGYLEKTCDDKYGALRKEKNELALRLRRALNRMTKEMIIDLFCRVAGNVMWFDVLDEAYQVLFDRNDSAMKDLCNEAKADRERCREFRGQEAADYIDRSRARMKKETSLMAEYDRLINERYSKAK